MSETSSARNPVVSKHQIQPEYGDEQADAREGMIAEPVSRDQILRWERGQGNIHFPCSADHVQDCGNLTRLIHTLAICVAIRCRRHHHSWVDSLGMFVGPTLVFTTSKIFSCPADHVRTGLLATAYITQNVVWLRPNRLM